LKLYNPERAQAPVCGVDEKTYRKWVWIALEALAELDLVSRCRRPCWSRVDRSIGVLIDVGSRPSARAYY